MSSSCSHRITRANYFDRIDSKIEQERPPKEKTEKNWSNFLGRLETRLEEGGQCVQEGKGFYKRRRVFFSFVC